MNYATKPLGFENELRNKAENTLLRLGMISFYEMLVGYSLE